MPFGRGQEQSEARRESGRDIAHVDPAEVGARGYGRAGDDEGGVHLAG